MKKVLTFGLIIVLAIMGLGSSSLYSKASRTSSDYSDFIRGVDISMLAQIEELGGKYYQNGVQKDAIKILADNGANYVRLRLWVNPYDSNGNSYGGGHNDYATTLALAKRAKAAGMKVLIDFHLSDYWADPGTQSKPKAWKDLSYSSLKTTLYNYMKTTMTNFKNAGCTPDMVQIGNETSSGILWDDGLVGSGNDDFTKLGELLNSAITGVRDVVGSSTKIILHLDNGGSYSLYTWWFGSLLESQPNLDFDIVGLTYYPMWHGTLDELQYNMNNIVNTYNKDVCVVETAYGWTTADGDGLGSSFNETDATNAGYPATVQGQIDFMDDLESVILNVPDNRGLGFFYWEPEWTPVDGAYWGTEAGKAYINDNGILSNPWDNLTLFDFNGNALDSIKILNAPTKNTVTNPSFELNGVTNTPTGWNVWLGTGADTSTVKTEWGGYSEDYKLSFWDDSNYTCSIYQTISGLENGTYSLSAWIMSSGGQSKCQIYAKNYGGTEKIGAVPTSDIGWMRVTIDNIQVTNGKCEIGLYTIANANNWINIDQIIFRKK